MSHLPGRAACLSGSRAPAINNGCTPGWRRCGGHRRPCPRSPGPGLGRRHALRREEWPRQRGRGGARAPGFAGGRRGEPPSRARTPVPPTPGRRCEPGVLRLRSGSWPAPGGPQVARAATATGVLSSPAHCCSAAAPTRRLSDRQLGAAGRMPVRSLFSGRGTSVSWVQTCGPELCSLFSAETWAQSGVQGTSPPPSSWRVCRQRPRGHSRCTRKTCFQCWSCQYFSGKRQEHRSLLLDGGGVFTYFSRPRTGPDW